MPGAKVRIFIFPDIAAVFSRSIAPIAENNIILYGPVIIHACDFRLGLPCDLLPCRVVIPIQIKGHLNQRTGNAGVVGGRV